MRRRPVAVSRTSVPPSRARASKRSRSRSRHARSLTRAAAREPARAHELWSKVAEPVSVDSASAIRIGFLTVALQVPPRGMLGAEPRRTPLWAQSPRYHALARAKQRGAREKSPPLGAGKVAIFGRNGAAAASLPLAPHRSQTPGARAEPSCDPSPSRRRGGSLPLAPPRPRSRVVRADPPGPQAGAGCPRHSGRGPGSVPAMAALTRPGVGVL
jgi:hypothetical protein